MDASGGRVDVHRLHGVCFDQIFNQAAKFKYVWWQGRDAAGGADDDWGRFASGFPALAVSLSDLHAYPGLKVVIPSTPYDAKGLMIQSIRDNDLVIFCEHKSLYGLKGCAGGFVCDPVQ